MYSTDTQEEAHQSALSRRHTLIDSIETTLRSNPYGLTADEIATKLNESPFAIRPRITEMKQAGTVTDSGVRRMNVSGKYALVVQIPLIIAGNIHRGTE